MYFVQNLIQGCLKSHSKEKVEIIFCIIILVCFLSGGCGHVNRCVKAIFIDVRMSNWSSCLPHMTWPSLNLMDASPSVLAHGRVRRSVSCTIGMLRVREQTIYALVCLSVDPCG